MPLPIWNPPPVDPAKPWTRPVPGDERRVPPPSEDGWWNAIRAGDVERVQEWLAGPTRYAYDDPRSALLRLTDRDGFTALGWLVDDPSRAVAAERLIPALISGNSSPLGPGHVPHVRTSPFWTALAHPHERVARTMWDHLGPDRVMNPSWLHMAVEEGCDSPVIRRLLAWGLPVNDQGSKGETALHAVIHHWITTRDKDLLDPLLTAGADPRIKDHGQQSALNLARWSVARHSSLAPVVERLERLAVQLDEREALLQALAEVPQTGEHVPAVPRPRL